MMIMAVNGLSYLNQINRTSGALNSSLRKLASGSNYPDASYGASGYSIQVRMQSNIGTAVQSRSNTQTANAMLSTALGGVESTVSSLSSLRSQLINAANGTNGGRDIAALRENIGQTISTIDENSSIEYNGMRLLDGSRSVTVAGDNGYRSVQLGNLSAAGLGLVDENGRSTLDLSSPEGIASALDTVDAALDRATGVATDIGSAQQGLSFSEDSYSTSIYSLTESYSTEGDVDMAAEAVKFSSAKVQNELALYAAKLHMQNGASVLALLQ